MGGVVAFAGFRVPKDLELTGLGCAVDCISEGIYMRNKSSHCVWEEQKLCWKELPIL